MRTYLRWIGWAVLGALVIALVIGLVKRNELMRLWAVNSLFTEEKIVSNFSNMDRAFLSTPVPRGDLAVSDLPHAPPMRLPEGAGTWIKARAVTSLLVLKDGQIVHESYHQGTKAEDRRISWSIAKSYISALFGVLLDEGAIGSLDDPVTRYAPALIGSAYDGVRIRDVLLMSSGVTFDEDYLDYDSDINRMGRVIALGGHLDDFTAGLTERFQPAGEGWKYVSIDTHVIGMVIRGATGRSIPALLSEKIIAPLGQEADGYYLTDGAGVAFVLGGLNLRTRDFARFGLMFAQGGRYGGRQVVPAEWVAQSTKPMAKTEAGKMGYGYQWWIAAEPDPGSFAGRGVYGQYLYVDQPREVVIVVTAADRSFRDAGVNAANMDMLEAIAAATTPEISE